MAPREIDDMPQRGRKMTMELLAMIRALRREHHACTVGEVARMLKQPKQTVAHRLTQLRERELVSWTELPGSVHLTLRGGKILDWLNRHPDGEDDA